MTPYQQKLQRPEWQRKRLEVLQRDDWTCNFCGARDKQLHVDHKRYDRDLEPWEYKDSTYQTLCKDCHVNVTAVRKYATDLTGYLNFEETVRVAGYVIGRRLLALPPGEQEWELPDPQDMDLITGIAAALETGPQLIWPAIDASGVLHLAKVVGFDA